MKYALGNMLNGAGGLNPDGLSLDLQFATDKTLTARKGPTPVFTRANATATFIGSDGLIQTAIANQARFDHDPVTLACKGLLIEESRTNLLLRSEEFDNVYWSVTRAAISADQTTSPTGATTADKLITDSSVVNNHRIDRASITLALNTAYTISVFAKASEYSGFAIGVDAGSPVLGVQFSLSGSGSVTAQLAGYTGTIQNFGNGWFRCTATFTSSAVFSTHRVYMYLGQNGTTFTYTGDGTSGIFLWGAQLEAGSLPTSYIPTTTASVVRSADVCSITGSDFTNIYNNSAGTLLSEVMIANLIGDNRGIAQIDSGVNDNIIRHSYTFSVGGFNTVLRSSLDATTVLSVVAGTASTIQKRITAYEGTSFASATNGGTVATATRTFPVGLNALRIGNIVGGSFYLNGHIAAIRFYKKRLANAKLQTLTA